MTRATIERITAAWLVVAAFYVGIMGTLALVHYAMEWMK
jgi:rRNA processing protein Krr1/Pno1